ncbi:hypothetical protein ABK040_013603 [Willaertia magna]
MNNVVYACGDTKEGCQGKDFSNQPEDSKNIPYQKVQLPFLQSTTSTIKEIYYGYYTAFFLLENGQVYACGDNSSYQLGVKNEAIEIYEPELVQIFNDKIIEVAPSVSRTWFFGESGSFYLAGSNPEEYKVLNFENNETSDKTIRKISPTTQQPKFRDNEIIKNIYSFGDDIIITKYNNLYYLYLLKSYGYNTISLKLQFSFPFKVKKFSHSPSYRWDYAILFEENNLCLLKQDNTFYFIENIIDICVGFRHVLFCVKYFCKDNDCFKQKLIGCGDNLDGQICPKDLSKIDSSKFLKSDKNLILTKILQNEDNEDKLYLLEKEMKNNLHFAKYLRHFTLYSNNFKFVYLTDFSGFIEFEGTNSANEWVENIVSVSCGGRHSGFVTKYGQVFGFGFNENYQIGTDKVDKGICENVFFQDELMKYNATEYIPQIRCGGRSTIVFLKKIGKKCENHFLFLQKITKNNELCDVDFILQN